jgi:hypothetical protein
MPLSSSNATRQLSDGNTLGTILGTGTTDLIGFYGLTAGVARGNVNGASYSSGALASSLAFQLNRLGLIECTTFAP